MTLRYIDTVTIQVTEEKIPFGQQEDKYRNTGNCLALKWETKTVNIASAIGRVNTK